MPREAAIAIRKFGELSAEVLTQLAANNMPAHYREACLTLPVLRVLILMRHTYVGLSPRIWRGIRTGKGCNFAFEMARQGHVFIVFTCCSHQQRVHEWSSRFISRHSQSAIAGRNTARSGAFCYSGGATTLAVSAPAFWRSLRLPNSPERMMLGCIRKLLSFKLPM